MAVAFCGGADLSPWGWTLWLVWTKGKGGGHAGDTRGEDDVREDSMECKGDRELEGGVWVHGERQDTNDD